MMLKEFAPILLGFLLTTVLGGFLGVYLQQRSWAHRFKVERATAERDRAVQVFEETSRLLDRRLYRMRRLAWTLEREHDRPLSAQGQKSLGDYDAVLFDWNDSINRNLALLERYFGTERRDDLDYKIGALMRSVGAALEQRVRLENARAEDLGGLQSDLKDEPVQGTRVCPGVRNVLVRDQGSLCEIETGVCNGFHERVSSSWGHAGGSELKQSMTARRRLCYCLGKADKADVSK